MMQSDYAGADWLREAKFELSDFGARVADLLGDLYYGIYHIPMRRLAVVEWSNPHWIELSLDGSFATYDSDRLTRLVLLAHDRAVRADMSPRSNKTLSIQFHPRQRGGQHHQRHPTIEQALAQWREHGPLREAL